MQTELDSSEIVAHAFDAAYPLQPDEACRYADSDARKFVRLTGLPEEEVASLRPEFLNKVEAHVYPGVLEMVTTWIEAGDSLAIWTVGETHGDPAHDIPGFAGQMRKVVTSHLRPEAFGYPHLTLEEKARFRVWSVDTKKDDLLPDILADFEARGIQHVLLADDKAKNLLKARETVEKTHRNGVFSGTVDMVWVNQGRSKDTLPKGYQGTLADFKKEFTTVSSISEYGDLVRATREPFGGEPLGHILDWDHTLADETARKAEIREHLIYRYAKDFRMRGISYLSPEDATYEPICELLGILPSRALIEPLKGGASKVGIYRVNWDGKDCVVKHEADLRNKGRITDEITAHRSLNGVFKPRMPIVHDMGSHPKLGEYIVMDYRHGPDLRRAIREKLLPDEEILAVVGQVLEIQKAHWQSEPHITDHSDWFSMPKSEWNETKHLLGEVFSDIARQPGTGLSLSEFLGKPLSICTSQGEHRLPPLSQIIAYFDDFMAERPPVILGHAYNDLSLANILAVFEDRGVRAEIIDPQWYRANSDPAADLARIHKGISSTTVKGAGGRITLVGERLMVEPKAIIPPVLTAIEAKVKEDVPEFSKIIGDPTLPVRVELHLAASQLREIALTRQRGKPEQVAFNLFLFALHLEEAYGKRCSL